MSEDSVFYIAKPYSIDACGRGLRPGTYVKILKIDGRKGLITIHRCSYNGSLRMRTHPIRMSRAAFKEIAIRI